MKLTFLAALHTGHGFWQDGLGHHLVDHGALVAIGVLAVGWVAFRTVRARR